MNKKIINNLLVFVILILGIFIGYNVKSSFSMNLEGYGYKEGNNDASSGNASYSDLDDSSSSDLDVSTNSDLDEEDRPNNPVTEDDEYYYDNEVEDSYDDQYVVYVATNSDYSYGLKYDDSYNHKQDKDYLNRNEDLDDELELEKATLLITKDKETKYFEMEFAKKGTYLANAYLEFDNGLVVKPSVKTGSNKFKYLAKDFEKDGKYNLANIYLVGLNSDDSVFCVHYNISGESDNNCYVGEKLDFKMSLDVENKEGDLLFTDFAASKYAYIDDEVDFQPNRLVIILVCVGVVLLLIIILVVFLVIKNKKKKTAQLGEVPEPVVPDSSTQEESKEEEPKVD